MRDLDLDDPEDREYVVKNCAATLVAIAADSKAGGIVVQVNDVTRQGIDYGTWLVSVERIPDGMMN